VSLRRPPTVAWALTRSFLPLSSGFSRWSAEAHASERDIVAGTCVVAHSELTALRDGFYWLLASSAVTLVEDAACATRALSRSESAL